MCRVPTLFWKSEHIFMCSVPPLVWTFYVWCPQPSINIWAHFHVQSRHSCMNISTQFHVQCPHFSMIIFTHFYVQFPCPSEHIWTHFNVWVPTLVWTFHEPIKTDTYHQLIYQSSSTCIFKCGTPSYACLNVHQLVCGYLNCQTPA